MHWVRKFGLIAYIKTKRNRKLEIKFFDLFSVLYLVENQAYKLELPARWRIYNMFHVSLLHQDITKKWQEFLVLEFELGNNKKYEVEAI